MSRQLSQQNERILKITERLSGINVGANNTRFNKLDSAEQRLTQLESQFEEVQETFHSQLNKVKDTVSKLQKVIEEEKHQRDTDFEDRGKEIAALEQKFTGATDELAQSRKDTESKYSKILEDKISNLKQDIQREATTRNDSIDYLHQNLENDIPKISETITQEAQEREETDQSIMKNISDEIVKTNNFLQQEKKGREESQDAICDMLKDIVNRVNAEVDQEKKQREETEEHLLALLEEATGKLNTASNL